MINIIKQNETYIKIDCDDSVARELYSVFSFEIPNYQFMPAYRFSNWDGKKHLFTTNKRIMYAGLYKKLIDYFNENNYEYTLDSELVETDFSAKEAFEFCDSLNSKFKIKPHQLKGFIAAIRQNRGLFLSPTASGKSFIIYNICKYFKDKKILIIVPTVDLVDQLYENFEEYDLDKTIEVQKIYQGEVKKVTKQITISTWQSIYKLGKAWFNQFEVIIGDEAHKFESASLTSILEKADEVKYRFGFTGTLKDSKINELVLEGLFGPKYIVATIEELQKSKDLAELKIKSLVLEYPDHIKKQQKRKEYPDEIEFIIGCEWRNQFIKKLALSLPGNTLILFSRIKHGDYLYDIIKKENNNPTYLVHGLVDKEDRAEIRKIVNTHKDSTTVASFKTFSTGIDIPNLNNVVFVSPSKARITIMQSIGRGLRVSKIKTKMTLYDVVDDLSWKKWSNYALKHYFERIKMYISEKMPYKQYNIKVNINENQ